MIYIFHTSRNVHLKKCIINICLSEIITANLFSDARIDNFGISVVRCCVIRFSDVGSFGALTSVSFV